MEHQMLQKLNDTLEKVIDKIDGQGQRLTGIEVKVDLYRESQNDVIRKVETVDKTATEAMASTKAAHKRLDDMAESEKWLKRAVITMALSIVGGVALAVIKGWL